MKKLLAAVTVLAVSTAQADSIHVDDANCPGPGSGTVGDPYCSVQTAIDNAVDTDEIVVAPGTYFETIDFLGKAIWLHSSDGAEVTIIDGTGFFHVVQCVSNEGLDTVVDGFTITGGNADGDGFPDNRGGGMFNQGSSPTVTNCTFIGNMASSAGGGMANNAQSSPTVTNCTFIGNMASSAGGGMFNQGQSHAMVTNCTFTGNDAERGGGMYNVRVSSPTVTNCTFTGNDAERGGGMYNNSDNPTVTNCTFIGNMASSAGGGMYNNGSVPTLTNCTFSGNTASFGGGMNNIFGGSAIVTNCVLWGNSPDQIIGSRIPIVSYSDVQGGWPGTGNIDADPLFVDPLNGDFRLSAGSPCIEAGNNNAIVNLTDTDLDGNPRFADDPDTLDTGCGVPVVVDMGAYEYQGVPATVVFADLNGDGIVTFIGDAMILNGCVGSDDPDCCIADLDLDGVVGMSDRILMWGELIEFLPVR